MKYTYKPAIDVLFVRIAEGKLHHGEQKGNVISHFSKDGKLLELEILDASKEMMHMIQSVMKSKQAALADSD